MSDLIVIGYPDQETGEKAYAEAQRLADELIMETSALGLVTQSEDGKFKVETPHGPGAGKGAAWGAIIGGLFGMILFIPFIGAALGGAMGALFGGMDKAGIDDEFRSRVQAMMTPGTSALIMVVEKVTPDKAVEAMSGFGGEVLKTSLTHDAEQQLQEALHGKA